VVLALAALLLESYRSANNTATDSPKVLTSFVPLLFPPLFVTNTR
jgi:hypothetical protein